MKKEQILLGLLFAGLIIFSVSYAINDSPPSLSPTKLDSGTSLAIECKDPANSGKACYTENWCKCEGTPAYQRAKPDANGVPTCTQAGSNSNCALITSTTDSLYTQLCAVAKAITPDPGQCVTACIDLGITEDSSSSTDCCTTTKTRTCDEKPKNS